MFLVALHSVGTLVALEIPWPVGPRNSGHSSARAVTAAEQDNDNISEEILVIIFLSSRRSTERLRKIQPGFAPIQLPSFKSAEDDAVTAELHQAPGCLRNAAFRLPAVGIECVVRLLCAGRQGGH